MSSDVIRLVVAFLILFGIFLLIGRMVLRLTSRRRPESFQHDGRTYMRQPDGRFVGPDGMIVGAAMIGVLAAAYASQNAKSQDNGWSGSGGTSDSSDASSSDGGGGDGGGDGGGGGGD